MSEKEKRYFLDRRKFIKITTITGIGCSLTMFPLPLFAQTDPKFRRLKKSFYISSDANQKLFIYTENFDEDIFDIEKAFKEYDFRFLMIFYSGTPKFDDEEESFLKHQLGLKRIIWISFNSFRQVTQWFSIVIAEDELTAINISYLNVDTENVSVKLKIGASPKIKFQKDRNSFIVNANGEEDLSFTANNNKIFFNEFEIPLLNLPTTTKGYNSIVELNFGCLRFHSTHFENNKPIKPYSPYIVQKKKEDSSQSKVFKLDYFEEKSFADNIELLATISPYKDFDNSSQTPSYIELIRKNKSPVYWNGVDEFGSRFLVADFKEFLYRMVKLRADEYMFIPYNKLSLTTQADRQFPQLLLGYSGTERILGEKNATNQLDLVFITSKKVSVNNSQDGFNTNEDSLTSKIWFQPKTYCIDADKSPIFENENGKDVDSNVKRISYKPIPAGMMGDSKQIINTPGLFLAEQITKQHAEGDLESIILPIIPTLLLNTENPEFDNLIELEKVFSKVRLNNFRKLQTPELKATEVYKKIQKDLVPKNFVTPQGFLRNNDKSIDFIKPDTQTVDGNSQKIQFKISEVGFASDFYLSLNKEDVFFVLKPSMLNRKTEKIDVRFSIRDFVVELSDFIKMNDTPLHNDTYLIFKFSKHSVDDLLQDPSKWSNYGNYKVDLPNVADKISHKIREFRTGTDDPGKDYFYFTETIQKDPNWNGIVILNIPIADNKNLPPIFTGLTSSQRLQKDEKSEKLKLNTSLNFKYVAFPVNKTFINKGKIEIKSSSFYGLIDYDTFKDKDDYTTCKSYFTVDGDQDLVSKFLLSRILVRFENSEIRNFQSYAFIKIKKLFENNVSKFKTNLTNNEDGSGGDPIENLIRLGGQYQKTSADQDQFIFSAKSSINITFDDGNILSSIDVEKVSFNCSGDNTYRFDIDASAKPGSWANPEIISIDELKFQNIGLQFNIGQIAIPKIPTISFDWSKLFILPKINFNCIGFLKSFPISFSHFQVFKFKRSASDFVFDSDFDFLKFPLPHFKLPNIEIDSSASLFCFIFDFDFGTLGDLSFLKALKGQLLVGWSMKGGFVMGFKLNGPSTQGLHINLFGALKIDIQELDLCVINGQYLLAIKNGRLSILGLELPSSDSTFNGLIFAKPGEKIAWLVTLLEKNDKPQGNDNKLILGIGQRVTIPDLSQTTTSVESAFQNLKDIFKPGFTDCKNGLPQVYAPQNNWLIASEKIIPSSLASTFDLKLLFNDPSMYGLFIKIIDLFSIDILYKKLSDDLGIWSLEFALDPSIRTIDAGELTITLPNLGIDISTNGDWKLDVGFPKGNDWSRSCLVQLRPFVGWGGMYISRLKTASLSLFHPLYDKCVEDTTIFQAGFAVRIGIGAYLDKGTFYVGASISVYGIMEGAFAFKNGPSGRLKQLLPAHFAIMGRVGAIAELIGYVDFKIVKASIHIILRIEVGLTLFLIEGHLQPIPLYIEGEVQVDIDFTIACFSVFGGHICITIHLSFHAYVRFAYSLGGSPTVCNSLIALDVPHQINIPDIKEIPVIFIPTFTKSIRGTQLIYNFAIPFFGIGLTDDHQMIIVSAINILKDKILKPLFSGIFKSFDVNQKDYDYLRNILLGNIKDDNGKEIPFIYPNFKPTFLVGYDNLSQLSPTDLENYFGLTNEELNKFLNFHCGDNTNSCLFRSIPLPICSTIKVVEKNKDSWETDKQGFNIEIGGIFSDPEPVKNNFKTNRNYSAQKVNQFQKQFENYTTQFPSDKLPLADGNYDLREDLILSEYFRMIGLVALESYYNFLFQIDENRAQKNKENPNSLNPIININNLFSDSFTDENDILHAWDFNDPENIKKIIGQANYFFNNGLRLIDLANNNSPIYSILNQVKQVNGFLYTKESKDEDIKWEDIQVKINSNRSTDFTELKTELFSDSNSFKAFLGRAQELITLPDLQGQFTKTLTICNPYELVDVKLQIQNSRIKNTGKKDDTNAYGFFPIPNKIKEHFKDQNKCLLNLNIAKASTKDGRIYSNGPEVQKVSNIICTNIELQVKPYLSKDESSIIALEFSKVIVDDLISINNVKKELLFNENPKDLIKNILIYVTDDDDKIVAKIPTDNLLIIKTNLSPKTHPPIILESEKFQDSPDSTDNLYYSDLKDHKNFVRLMWEGMTANNGGIFFFSNNVHAFESIPKIANDVKIIISFEYTKLEKSEPTFGFNNYFKIANNQNVEDTQKSVFELIENNDYYLYTDVCVHDSDGNYSKKAKEYHSTIPAHCLSFEVERKDNSKDKNNPDQMSQYLPIDFQLTTNEEPDRLIIDRDSVIPIMPQAKKIDPNKPFSDVNIVKDHVYYNHVTPLINYDDKRVLNRYDGIGKTYPLTFSLRDIYGFRVIDKLDINIKDGSGKNIEYKHRYFDKIVPINSWPLIKFSYEFQDIQADNSLWSLKIELNLEKADKLITNDKGDTVISSLNTITAQLMDPNYKMYILNFDSDKKEELNELNNSGGNSYKTGIISLMDVAIKAAKAIAEGKSPLIEKPQKIFISFSIPVKNFRNILNPKLVLKRDVGDDWFFKLPDSIGDEKPWEYNAIQRIDAKLILSFDDKIKKDDPEMKLENALDKLNELLTKNPNAKDFTIGVGVIDESLERTAFLIRKSMIENIATGISLKSEDNFYGIKPYSTSLWSGKYKEKNFSDVDLDKGLRIILSKIDNILSPLMVQKNLADIKTLDKLIACKKLIVKGDYDILDKVDKKSFPIKLTGELSDKVENLVSSDNPNLFEFESLLLENLQNFYNYDGIVNIELPPNQILQDHRLTISVKNIDEKSQKEINKSYEIQSSKIYYNGTEKVSWTILFDYIANDDASLNAQPLSVYKFSINPVVTHIEYNIGQKETINGIQDSTWIQLITPINLDVIKVDEFPAIIREYPPKPSIKSNNTIQVTPDDEKRIWSSDLGKWQYLLGIKNDPIFLDDDKIHIKFKFQTPNVVSEFAPDDSRNFPGFIAFYSQDLAIDNDLDGFVNDLHDELCKPIGNIDMPSTGSDKPCANPDEDFVFQKNTGNWKLICSNDQIANRISLRNKGGNIVIENLIFDGLNIFPTKDHEATVSIKPDIWVTRNDDWNMIPNSNFKYKTAIVSPATWTTIHLKYFNAILVQDKLQTVFRNLLINNKCVLPLKCTAKYLLKTGDLGTHRNLSLPTLSVEQMEFLKGAEIPDIDKLFAGYDKDNGYPAISLTVSNDEQDGAENDLPVFSANTIFKI